QAMSAPQRSRRGAEPSQCDAGVARAACNTAQPAPELAPTIRWSKFARANELSSAAEHACSSSAADCRHLHRDVVVVEPRRFTEAMQAAAETHDAPRIGFGTGSMKRQTRTESAHLRLNQED